MARPQRSDDSPEPETSAEPQAPEPTKRPDDVLVYIDRLGPIGCAWNDAPKTPEGVKGPRAIIPTQRTVFLKPGLSFCPGDMWDLVKATPTWKLRTEQGAAKAIAGHGGDLVREWLARKTGDLVAKIEKSSHLEALLRLRDLEASHPHQGLAVAEAIDARLATMQAKVEAHTARRAQQRRGNRRASRL